MQTQIKRRRIRRLIRVCTVCLNYRKLNKTVLSRRSEPFSQPTLRDNRPTSAVSALILHLIVMQTKNLQFFKVQTQCRQCAGLSGYMRIAKADSSCITTSFCACQYTVFDLITTVRPGFFKITGKTCDK